MLTGKETNVQEGRVFPEESFNNFIRHKRQTNKAKRI